MAFDPSQIPSDVLNALAAAYQAQLDDATAQTSTTDAQLAVTAAENALTNCQTAEATAHSDATGKTNDAIQAAKTWIASAVPAAPTT